MIFKLFKKKKKNTTDIQNNSILDNAQNDNSDLSEIIDSPNQNEANNETIPIDEKLSEIVESAINTGNLSENGNFPDNIAEINVIQTSDNVVTGNSSINNDNEPVQTEELSTLEVKHLIKKFGSKVAVNDASFSMKQGEIVGLLGPNGAGKTTIFYMIVGFIKPTNGDIFLDRHKITYLQMYRRAKLGISYLSQEASVFRKLTVQENIDAVLESLDLPNEEKKRRKDEVMEDLGITRLSKQKAYSLSGGERRRTEIARALVLKPKFLLLDEPFAGVDPIAVSDIQGIIGGLRQKKIGVLITDHNVRETLKITNRAYIINLGNIFRAGNAEELVNDQMVRKLYLGENFSF